VKTGERPERPGQARATRFGRHLAVFVEDRALWPILLIFVVHVGLAGALLLLAALRDGSLLAKAALAILVMLCADLIRRAQQRRRVSFWIALLWTLSVLIAGAASYLGIL